MYFSLDRGKTYGIFPLTEKKNHTVLYPWQKKRTWCTLPLTEKKTKMYFALDREKKMLFDLGLPLTEEKPHCIFHLTKEKNMMHLALDQKRNIMICSPWPRIKHDALCPWLRKNPKCIFPLSQEKTFSILPLVCPWPRKNHIVCFPWPKKIKKNQNAFSPWARTKTIDLGKKTWCILPLTTQKKNC